MQHLGLLFVLAVLLINLWGVTLATGLFWKNRWMAAAAGPWIATTTFYAVENFHGLGDLRLGGTLGTLLSLALIGLTFSKWTPAWNGARADDVARRLAAWREEFSPRRMVACGAVFLAIFGYAMAWRFTYPNIDGSSEKLADFAYICSYYSGERIPVPDAWLHPYLSTTYYSFQHYAAALMGRTLGMTPGTAYNVGFCLLIGLSGVTFAGGVWLVATKAWVRWVAILGFVLGGTGVSGWVHLLDERPAPWSSMRFIGSAPLNKAPLGPHLKAYVEQFPKLDMPGEPFAYSIFLGDYHAPLASYYLLGVAVVAALLWHRERRRRYVALVGATLTWSLLANTWSLPLQGLGVMCWVAIAYREWRRLVPPLIVGAAAVWLAAWGYLTVFTSSASGYGTSIKLVQWDEHTPPLLFVMFLLPTIALALLGLVSGRSVGRWMGLVWLLFLTVSEFLYVDDLYGGEFNRFNTTLKWWPLISAGALLTLGPVLLEHATRRWVRISAAVLTLYPCVFFFDLAVNWWNGPKEAVGKMEGHAFLTKDHMVANLFEQLKCEPKGVVLERPEREGFTNSACLPLFAGHKLVIGWVGHEQLWRGNRQDLPQRQERIFQIYNGEMPDARPWLAAHGVDYVLWFREADTPELWDKVNGSITRDGGDWVWCEINVDGSSKRTGYWKRTGSVLAKR